MGCTVLLSAIAVGIAFTAPASAATTRHVTVNTDNVAGSLRQAVADSVDGDTVVIDPGVNPILAGEITVSQSITIEGQGASSSTVDGNLSGRVFQIAAGTVTIKKLTVTGGRSPAGAAGTADGGGIRSSGNLTLEEVVISGNSVGPAPERIAAMPGSCDNNPIAGGSTGARGGGVASLSGSLTVLNSTVSGNTAGTGSKGGTGGSCTTGVGGSGGFGLNGGDGGGVAGNGNPVVVIGSTITGNHAGTGGMGGTGGSSTFGDGAGGGAGGGGGGGGISGATTVLNSTIEGNFAGTGGAGGTGSTTGTSGSGGAGGGILGSTTTVTNSTIANNTAAASGGMTGPATIQNSLLVGNSLTGAGTTLNCDTLLITDGGHNLSFPAGDCTGFAHGDPLLGPLASNGGPTQTMALGAGGAALDQVPSSGSGCPATDQRGTTRPQGTACDIGAFEREVAAVIPPAGGGGATTAPAAPRKCKKGFKLKRGKCVKKRKKKK